MTSARFAGWRIGNGCSGTYAAADTLKHFFTCTFLSYDEVDQFLFGYYPTDSGKYYPIRGVAYSIGKYGSDFVCHQSANAYSLYKFGVTPVTYPESVNLYGSYGNLGISTRKDPVLLTEPYFGCVPGVQCHYNLPPHAGLEPLSLAAPEYFMSGAGYNLHTLWNPKNGWISSRADFQSVGIPIPAPSDETLYIDEVS